MTSLQIRQSFLDFFKSKQHTIVPSSSLMPEAPNLLFTNAGMNQFVPIFLGQKAPDVSRWAGAIRRSDTRAADTQKCIRAGGKHNDLDDVGLDTYHHTFFEMLGNWSFGDYFKREAIDWAWELVVEGWEFRANRLYATVFCPYLGQPGWEKKWRFELEQVLALAMTSPDFIAPSSHASPFEVSDQEAAMFWAKKFTGAGLNPEVHIIPGNRQDNFWMMGETGPCGPCSELHVDLTPAGDTRGALVNKGDPRCIEIWNLVFIQFNANPDGTSTPLPDRHVDTGMGFERVASIIQGTKGFKTFATAIISNYETDIFRPIFDAIEKLSGYKYGSTLPPADLSTLNPQQSTDIAFRVIADHIRTLSFAIADGIQPSNEGRGHVLRRILRRAVRYGRSLGFHEPFFYKLVDVVADTMGEVFPEVRARKKRVQEVIRSEEEAFNKTLDRGIELFSELVRQNGALEVNWARGLAFRLSNRRKLWANKSAKAGAAKKMEEQEVATNEQIEILATRKPQLSQEVADILRGSSLSAELLEKVSQDLANQIASHALEVETERKFEKRPLISAFSTFELSDTYGFPIDLTELMAREVGGAVNSAGAKSYAELQKQLAQEGRIQEVVSLSQIETTTPTKFVGYETLETPAKVLEVVSLKDRTAVILDTSACYAEMGGQVGDTGEIKLGSQLWQIANTQKSGNTWLHLISHPGTAEEIANPSELPEVGAEVTLGVHKSRRNAIERHHTVTHLLHWALHEVVSQEASQKGSFVGPDKLTFDFNSAPLTPAQVADIEKLVNERIVENAPVIYVPDVPYADVKSRKDVMQFFGDKYGDTVRVVQIGGRAGELDGYSMELCGGTHTRATGEIGLFRIVGESAIAAGVRRIEGIAGLEAYRKAADELVLIKTLAGKVNSPIHELEKKIESLLAQQKELEKQVKLAMLRNASNAASELLGSAQTVKGIPLITHNLGDADGEFLQATADALKGRFQGVVVLGGCGNNAVTLIATVSPDFTANVQAGKLIQAIAPIVGGKGGGKPDNARGGGKDASKLDEALARVKSLLI